MYSGKYRMLCSGSEGRVLRIQYTIYIYHKEDVECRDENQKLIFS
jgi:hypothetical protein